MYLEEIIGEIPLEDKHFECKSILNRNDIIGWLKTIAGFANADGGDFYIGVEDKTNKLIGFDRKGADSERNVLVACNVMEGILNAFLRISVSKYRVKSTRRF